MPEAVIVSTARTPIGRAMKGSLKTCRPDDLTAFIVDTALNQVPALDRQQVEDLILGCGQPAGESGFNIARVVAIQAGMPDVPGVTVNRYCSSSLQAIRMAAHAIKAGEGDVFVAAGVETVSRFMNGMADVGAAKNPIYDDAGGPHRRAPARAARATGPRPRACPTSTSPWARRPRTWPSTRTSAARSMDEFAALSQQRATASLENGFWEDEITPVETVDDEGKPVTVARTTASAPAPPPRAWPTSSRSSGPTARSPPATPARSTTAPPPWS